MYGVGMEAKDTKVLGDKIVMQVLGWTIILAGIPLLLVGVIGAWALLVTVIGYLL